MAEPWASPVSRRRFLEGVGGLALSSLAAPNAIARSLGATTLPRPERSGLGHVVVVMMENRSFDHLLGWLPHADGRQADLVYTDRNGVAHPTFPLAPDYAGCAYHDPDHTHEGGLIQYNGGKCDGFLRSGSTDLFAIGYYTQKDLPFLGRAAPYWTVCDRYFSPIMGSTEPNRLYLHTGMTDRMINSWGPSTLPTIWDRLAARRLRGAYYVGNLSFLSPHWGDKYDRITYPYSRFLADCRSGDLPERRVRGAGLWWERRPPEHRHPRRRVVPERGLPSRDDEPGLAPDAARDHVRRMGWLLRPCAAAARARRRSSSCAARFSRPLPPDLAFRSPPLRRAWDVRPCLDPEADRVALAPRAAFRSGRTGEEPRGRAGLLQPRSQSSAIRRPAGGPGVAMR